MPEHGCVSVSKAPASPAPFGGRLRAAPNRVCAVMPGVTIEQADLLAQQLSQHGADLKDWPVPDGASYLLMAGLP